MSTTSKVTGSDSSRVEDWQLGYVIESEPFPKEVTTRTISKEGTSMSDASKKAFIQRKWFPIAVQYKAIPRKGRHSRTRAKRCLSGGDTELLPTRLR
jgi:hypothetical protein